MRITPIRGERAPVLLCAACGLLCRPSALDGQRHCSRCGGSRLVQSGPRRKLYRAGLVRAWHRLGRW
ncbi:hypothetical protein GCM10010425_31460 [Streptomyces spororaveus]|uniref:Uncharacterized protein n=1 Tax=Streptomyces spororaveus TaxID=284039 RepID=A0ABQ3T6J7_9ACTN|nr:hypothetical protein Sspor_15310 [Streptomyces spororaveus]